MPFFRTTKRDTIENSNYLYNSKFLEKGVKKIVHLSTPTLVYPTAEELQSISFVNHIWIQGDSLEKLSSTYYGDPTYWWIISFINKKPTEQHFLVGDIVYVPTPLSNILSIVGY